MSVFMFSKLQLLLLLQPVMSSWRKHCMLMCMRRQNKDDDATSLDYRHSSLNDVPSDVFTHERTLEELRLDSNHIRDLPRVCTIQFTLKVVMRCSRFLVQCSCTSWKVLNFFPQIYRPRKVLANQFDS